MNSVQNPAYHAGMEARFASAARHSRMVRVLRIAVPAAVVLAMAAIVVVSVFNPFRMLLPKLPVDIGNLVVSGTKITMESPHMAGFSPDQRPYEFWAKTATQDLTDPDHVELNTLRAKVMMEDRTTRHDGCPHRLFDSKKQLLDLRKDIFLQSSTGYEARLSQALLDIGKGTVTSEERVDVKLLNGTLSADKLRILNSGEVVRFEGNVVMNLDDRTTPRPPRRTPEPSATAEDAVRLRQARQHEMILMMMFSRAASRPGGIRIACTALRAGAASPAGDAGAQGAVSGVPNAMQGFSQNRDQPIQIEAASLEMRDKKKEATFAGNVKVVQGDTTMTSKTLVVFYDSSSTRAGRGRRPPMPKAAQIGADAGRDPRARRQFVDPPAGGQGQRGRHPEGPGRDRRDRHLRHQGQHDHHARRHRADPVQERAARRPPDGRHDHRRLAGGIRQRAGAGPVHLVRRRGTPAIPGMPRPRRRRAPGPASKPK